MPFLKSKRLFLRTFSKEDLKKLCHIFSLEEVAKYEDFAPMTEKQVQSLLSEWMTTQQQFAVIEKQSGCLIGTVGYWIDENACYSLTFDFDPEVSGQGYAFEACKTLLNYLFEKKKIPQIFADCDVRNERACRLLERLGFISAAVLKNQNYKEGMSGNISLYRKRNDFYL